MSGTKKNKNNEISKSSKSFKSFKNYKNSKGGKVIASGGFGCIFSPALKCEGAAKIETDKVSKLMTERNATSEYEEINKIKDKLDSIPNYEDYFLLNDVTLCRPAKLKVSDMMSFESNCSALTKDGITKQNIHKRLNEVMALNLPNGGLPVDDYIYHDGSFEKIHNVHLMLIKLLQNGIIKMNEKHIYHSDIKYSNVLIDESEKARLIDWGLTTEYIPRDDYVFPKNWRNRPLQFNVPFSVVIFTDYFYEMYTEYLADGGQIEESALRLFVIDYLNYWLKERGAGHYKFINEIMFMLNSNELTSISEKNRPSVVETEITMPIIINYIIDVLLHYTKFKEDGSLDLREYLNNVYIKIVDIWGFILVYYPLLEMLFNSYFSLKEHELHIFKKLKYIFNEYLYNPRHEEINIGSLLDDLKELGDLINAVAHGKKKTTSSKFLASGINKHNKTKRHNNLKIFKRKKFVKRFKKTFFLSLK